MKANNVPMFTSSASVQSGTKPASAATATIVITVILCGVPKRPCVRPRRSGSRRSRDIANATRDWPSMSSITVFKVAASAPT